MRIIHCAPFNIFTKTGGALYSNPIKISLGFSQLGHYVHNFDYRDSARYFSMFKNKKRGQKKMLQHFFQLIDDLDPDLIVFGHAEMIPIESYEEIKRRGIKMIFWYNDLPLPSDLVQKEQFFEAIFTTASGMMMDELSVITKNGHFMPNLVDKSIEKHRAFENENYESDILFSGRYDNERAGLIDFIKDNIETTLPKKFVGLDKSTVIIGEPYLKEIANTKIALSHNRKFSTEYKWFTSDRMMHIMGNGTFCLSTPMIGAEDFFEDKLQMYSSLDELKQKCEYYLQNDQARKENAKWMYERCHELFNSKRVAQYFLDVLNQDTKLLKTYEWWND